MLEETFVGPILGYLVYQSPVAERAFRGTGRTSASGFRWMCRENLQSTNFRDHRAAWVTIERLGDLGKRDFGTAAMKIQKECK